MPKSVAFTPARAMRAVCILAAVFCLVMLSFEAASAANDVSANAAAASAVKASAPLALKPAIKPGTKPLWTELTPAQQQALAPLTPEWDKMDSLRKKKWLQIGNKFPNMKPEDQQRLQERMREWVKLTPEQRRVVRENYARSKKIDPSQKSAQWHQYQQLPEEQKKRLAADAAEKKRVTNLASSAQSKVKIAAPLKAAPKPPPSTHATPQTPATPAPAASSIAEKPQTAAGAPAPAPAASGPANK